MGRPDQGNKAQTPVGYSHGTRAHTGGLATAVTGDCPRVSLGEYVSGHTFLLALSTSHPPPPPLPVTRSQPLAGKGGSSPSSSSSLVAAVPAALRQPSQLMFVNAGR